MNDRELDTLIPSLCTRCGKCCLNENYMGNLFASADDVARWDDDFRFDILRYAYVMPDGTADLWIDENEREHYRCPFLRKDRGKPTYKCCIHDTKPKPCRDYPQDYDQMVRDGCEIVGELQKLGIDATGWMRAEKRRAKRH